jgi:hypothetical protein
MNSVNFNLYKPSEDRSLLLATNNATEYAKWSGGTARCLLVRFKDLQMEGYGTDIHKQTKLVECR